jgi:hypothetical protein
MKQIITDERFEVVASLRFAPSYKRNSFVNALIPRAEAGSNTSTVALRLVGDDERGSLESKTVKYGHESHETRT